MRSALSLRSTTALAAATTFLLAGRADALTIDWSALPDQTSPTTISQVDQETGTTVTATASAWLANGSVTSLDPNDPIGSGFTPLGVNIGGANPGSPGSSTHGLGCHATIDTECEEHPVFEGGVDTLAEVLLIEFDVPVTVEAFIGSAMEYHDEIGALNWDGSAFELLGFSPCDPFGGPFCSGEELIGSGAYPAHAPTRFFALFTATTVLLPSFKLTRIEGVTPFPVPEPSLVLLLGIGLLAIAHRHG